MIRHVVKIGNKAFLIWLAIMVPLVIVLTVTGYPQTGYYVCLSSAGCGADDLK